MMGTKSSASAARLNGTIGTAIPLALDFTRPDRSWSMSRPCHWRRKKPWTAARLRRSRHFSLTAVLSSCDFHARVSEWSRSRIESFSIRPAAISCALRAHRRSRSSSSSSAVFVSSCRMRSLIAVVMRTAWASVLCTASSTVFVSFRSQHASIKCVAIAHRRSCSAFANAKSTALPAPMEVVGSVYAQHSVASSKTISKWPSLAASSMTVSREEPPAYDRFSLAPAPWLTGIFLRKSAPYWISTRTTSVMPASTAALTAV